MKTTSKKGKKKTEPKDEDEYELIKKEDPLISPQEKSKFYDNKAVQIVAAAGVIALGTIVGLSLWCEMMHLKSPSISSLYLNVQKSQLITATLRITQV